MSSPAGLPPFSGDEPTCLKCGYEKASTMYLHHGECRHTHPGEHLIEGFRPNERLHRECFRCGYAWDEAIVPPELTAGRTA
ncbi:hypothetical protein [Streptosporangium sp. OZ121]|uniref:hypothetical protein n=1 Tax=Streptosporangium sp. OZ121 TaxID=3444183 RepID=UPI003F790AC4